MKFKYFILLFFLCHCAQNIKTSSDKKLYYSKGFAYIYNDKDFTNKIISKKLNNEFLQISNNKLRSGVLIKIINTKTQDAIILKNRSNIGYPEFYKILITKAVAQKLKLDNEMPLVELLEVKKNKSFVAGEAKIFNEEKKIHSNAPVEKVKIDNISKIEIKKKEVKKSQIYINIAEFYSVESANFLKKRIINEIKNFDSKKLIIKVKKVNKISLLSGPYNSINLVKNDYTLLKNYGFEELDISLNE